VISKQPEPWINKNADFLVTMTITSHIFPLSKAGLPGWLLSIFYPSTQKDRYIFSLDALCGFFERRWNQRSRN
jgi:hypothetical protein